MKKLLFLLLASSFMLCAMEQKEQTFESLPLEIQEIVLQYAATPDYKNSKHFFRVSKSFNHSITRLLTIFVKKDPDRAEKMLIESIILEKDIMLASNLIKLLPQKRIKKLLVKAARTYSVFPLLEYKDRDDSRIQKDNQKLINFLLFQPSGTQYAEDLIKASTDDWWSSDGDGVNAVKKALFKTIKHNDQGVFKRILKAVPIYCYDEFKAVPVYCYDEVIDFIISHPHNSQQCFKALLESNEKDLPLALQCSFWKAIKQNNTTKVKIMLDAIIDAILTNTVLKGYDCGLRLNYFFYRRNNSYEIKKTALNMAIKLGHFDTVKLLVDYGADVHKADKRGLTPFDAANQHKDDDFKNKCIKLLREKTQIKW